MNVSVVIPAYNAAETIGDTLQSLQDQSFTQWEAIVVDDGSIDRTVEVVQRFVEQDKRIRIFSQQNQGSSGARNSGVALAGSEWLLFLDADDWIFPQHLERLTDVLIANPSLDAVYCGWTYALPDGEYVFPHIPSLGGDLFVPFAQYCASIVHTFLVPRSLVTSLGQFNTTLRSCEDWSLWQRIARTGARFGTVPEVLAVYRTRLNSLSRNGHQLLKDGIQVVEQGHRPDPQVFQPHPVHPNGLPVEELAKNKFELLSACAGFLIGGGKDARSLLEALQGEACSELKPDEMAQGILLHTLVSASRPRSEWRNVWADCQALTWDFLLALEAHSGTKNLAHQTYSIIQKRLAEYIKDPHPQYSPSNPFDHMKQLIKRSLWTTSLILPTFRKPVRSIQQLLTSRDFQPAAHPSQNPKEHFEKLFTEHLDPWSYTNRYEQIKYEQTLDMIPNVAIENALELACAEGHFTVQFASRVKQLLATDISQTALDRCEQRCRDFDNVTFECLDFSTETIVDQFDLITCSEVLYFVGDRHQLYPVVENFANALKPGGYLIMTHSNVLIDDSSSSGFDWGHAFGAKFIGETFARSPQLEFIQELQTPLYRIQLFQRRTHRPIVTRRTPKKVEYVDQIEYHHLPPDIAEGIVLTQEKTLPILSYRQVSSRNESGTGLQMIPEVFEAQLQYLRDAGYRSISLSEWGYSVISNSPVNHKSIAIVFEDAHPSFATEAWSLLKKYGFTATLLLYADEVGKLKTTDPISGDAVPLMEWKQIRHLQAEGLMFGSYGLSRGELTDVSLLEAWKSLKRSREIFQAELAVPISVFAYPRGKLNPALQYLVGLAGYDFAISTTSGICTKQHSLLALPRLAVNQSTDLKKLLHD